jgi:hypothetical protein
MVIVHFLLPVPTRLTGEKRERQNYLPHWIRPDGDNLEKFLNDCCKGIVWEDDSQISWILRSKSKSSEEKGRTIFYVQEMPDAFPDYEAIMKIMTEHINIKEQYVIKTKDRSPVEEAVFSETHESCENGT